MMSGERTAAISYLASVGVTIAVILLDLWQHSWHYVALMLALLMVTTSLRQAVRAYIGSYAARTTKHQAEADMATHVLTKIREASEVHLGIVKDDMLGPRH